MPQLFANNAYSALASAITNVATSIPLAVGTGSRFPSLTGGDGGNFFLLTLANISGGSESAWEIVKVTARSGDTLTVVRAQEGTTAQAWAGGTPVDLRITSGSMNGKQSVGERIVGLKEAKMAMGANAIDLALGNVFTKTFTAGSVSLTVINIPATDTVGSFILEATNAGLATITWPTGTKWAGGTAPTLTASGVDLLGFYTHDGGTTWRGMLLAKDSK